LESNEEYKALKGHNDAKIIEARMFGFADTSIANVSDFELCLLVGQGERASECFSPLQIGVPQIVKNLRQRDHVTGRIKELNVAVECKSGTGRFIQTGVVTLVPGIVLVNNHRHVIEFQQNDNMSSYYRYKLDQKQSKAFHWVLPKDESKLKKLLQFRFVDEGWEWSCPIPINIGEHFIRVRSINRKEPRLISCKCFMDGGTTFISISGFDKKFPPYRIENRTIITTFRFAQAEVNYWTVLEPMMSKTFAWDDINGTQEVVINLNDTKMIMRYSIKKIGKLPSIIVDSDKGKRELFVGVQERGLTKVLVISDFPINFEDTGALQLKVPSLRDELSSPDNQRILSSRVTDINMKKMQLTEAKKKYEKDLDAVKNSKRDRRPRYHIEILEATNLFPSRFQAYVIVALDGKTILKTETRDSTGCAIWNGRFTLYRTKETFLEFAIWDKHMLSDTFLGRCQVGVNNLKLKVGHDVTLSLILGQRKSSDRVSGSIKVKISNVGREEEQLQLKIDQLESKIVSLQEAVSTVQKVWRSVEVRETVDVVWQRYRVKILGANIPQKYLPGCLFLIRLGDVVRLAKPRSFITTYTWINEKFNIPSSPPLERLEIELWYHVPGTIKMVKICSQIIPKSSLQEDIVPSVLRDHDMEEKGDYKEPRVQSWVLGTMDDLEKIVQATGSINMVEKNKLELNHEVKDNIEKLRGGNIIIYGFWAFRPAAPEGVRTKIEAHVIIPELGTSLVDSTPKELLYIGIMKQKVLFKRSAEQDIFEFTVKNLQIDCQVRGNVYDNVLAPTPVDTRYVKPFLSVGVNRSIHDCKNLELIQFATILMQGLTVQLEERLIWQLFSMVNEFFVGVDGYETFEYPKAITEEEGKALFTRDVQLEGEAPPVPELNFFFKTLLLQPIKLTVSLKLDPRYRQKALNVNLGFLMVVIELVEKLFGDLHERVLTMEALKLEDIFGDSSTVIWPITKHYKNSILLQVYKLMGLLGAPIELVSGLGSSAIWFLYEPAKGLTTSPAAFGRGLGKGTLGLLDGWISGVTEIASTVTGTVGKIAERGILDDDYMQERRQEMGGKGPQHIGDGLVKGVKGLGKGVFGGVTGVLVDPIKGARRGGAKGFFKGIGSGIAGVVAKPVVGVMDLATNTLEGVGHTVSYAANKIEGVRVRPLSRLRMPRVIVNGRLNPYSNKTAAVSQVLWELRKSGFDPEQLRGRGAADIQKMLVGEKIFLLSGANNGLTTVVGSCSRFLVIHLLRVVTMREGDFRNIENVHSVVHAVYGCPGSFGTREQPTGDNAVDITKILNQELLDDDAVIRLSGKNMLEEFGIDPWINHTKTLRVRYIPLVTGREKTVKDKDIKCFSARSIAKVWATQQFINIKVRKVDDSALHLLDNKELEFTNQEWTEKVQCLTTREAKEEVYKINLYLCTLFPSISRAIFGVIGRWQDITKPLQNLIDKRRTRAMLSPSANTHVKLFGNPAKGKIKVIVVNWQQPINVNNPSIPAEEEKDEPPLGRPLSGLMVSFTRSVSPKPVKEKSKDCVNKTRVFAEDKPIDLRYL